MTSFTHSPIDAQGLNVSAMVISSERPVVQQEVEVFTSRSPSFRACGGEALVVS